jgi:hypothetical protein
MRRAFLTWTASRDFRQGLHRRYAGLVIEG